MFSPPLRFAALVIAITFAPLLRADIVSSDGKIHVTYWEKWTGFEADAMRELVARYNASQSRIKVDYFTTSLIDRKVLVATAGGDPPDVTGLWTRNISTFADAAALRPLDEFIERDGMTVPEWLSRFYPAYANLCLHAGKVYAGISTPAAIALHWNKDLFREAGLDPEQPPRTLEELMAFSRKLTKRDPATGALIQVGFLPQDPGWWPWAFCYWFGGELFDGKNITLGTDPHNLAAMQWVESYTRELGLDDLKRFASGFGVPGGPDAAFLTGRVAIILQGVWYDNYIKQYTPNLNYGVTSWPSAVPGVDDFTMIEADMLCIPVGARNPDAAWEFIKYVNSNNPEARSWDEVSGGEIVTFRQGKNSPLRQWSPYFIANHPHRNIEVFRQLSASPHAAHLPIMGIWQEYDREMMVAFERIRLLEATPADELARAQTRLQASWENYRRSLIRHGQADVLNTPPPDLAPGALHPSTTSSPQPE